MEDDPADFLALARARLDAFLAPEADPRQARTRERILHAATDLFAAYGYRKTSVDDVASAARVAKGTVYLYFSNKAELLLHALALQKRQSLEMMTPAFDPRRAPADRLRELIRLGIQMPQRWPLLGGASDHDHEIEQALHDVDAATLTRINEEQIVYMAELIESAAPERLPRAVVEERAQVLIDLIFAVTTSGRLVRNGMSAEAHASVVADVLVHGALAAP